MDGTGPFDEIGHSPDAIELMEKMLIGEVIDAVSIIVDRFFERL